MGEIRVKALVEGGKASAGPPLGPTLAENKLDVKQVIAKVNEKTKSFEGMEVPVEVIVNTETKEIDVKVGTPPVSALIKKELNVKKLALTPFTVPKPKEGEAPKEEFKGSLTMDQVVSIAKAKLDSFGTRDLKKAVKQVVGSCVSCGVYVEEKRPKEIQKEIDEGKWDSKIK